MILPVFIFICVTAVTIVLFGFWLCVAACRLLWRLFNRMTQSDAPSINGQQCSNTGCRTLNPTHARYCRRCGSNLLEVNDRAKIPFQQPRYNPSTGRGRQVA